MNDWILQSFLQKQLIGFKKTVSKWPLNISDPENIWALVILHIFPEYMIKVQVNCKFSNSDFLKMQTCRILLYEYYRKESEAILNHMSERILKFKINNFTFNYCFNILSEQMFKKVLIISFQQATKRVLLFILNSFKCVISVTEKPVKEKTCCIQKSEIQDKNHTVNTLPQRVVKGQNGDCAPF